jgi:hypothetical protein
MAPKVSALVPCYNSSAFLLERALRRAGLAEISGSDMGLLPKVLLKAYLWSHDAPGKSGRRPCENLEPGVYADLGGGPFGSKQDRFNRLLTDQKPV